MLKNYRIQVNPAADRYKVQVRKNFWSAWTDLSDYEYTTYADAATVAYNWYRKTYLNKWVTVKDPHPSDNLPYY